MNTKRKFSLSLVLMFVTLILVATSCISDKKIIYLQGAENQFAVPQEITQAFELDIQPDDELAISVTSKEAKLIAPFDNNTLIGSGSGKSVAGSSSSATSNTTSGVAYFLVDKMGNIDFPIFGTLEVNGKTCRQLAAEIQDRMRSEGYIADAVVNVKIMSFKVTVMGDVKNPGVQTHTGERLTLLEALGRAGDMNNSAKRESVLVIREENGQRIAYEVDMRSSESIFASPAYYLQQNDVVYVKPNKSVRVKGSTGYTLLTIGSTVVSMLVSVTTLIIALVKLK